MLWLFLLLMLGGAVPKLVVREEEVASITMDRLRAEAELVASSRTLELSTNIRSYTVPQRRHLLGGLLYQFVTIKKKNVKWCLKCKAKRP